MKPALTATLLVALVGCGADGDDERARPGGTEGVTALVTDECPLADACVRTACHAGDVWCFDDCDRPHHIAAACLAREACEDGVCAAQPAPGEGEGETGPAAPGRPCTCDDHCAQADDGGRAVCVFGVCMAEATGPCSAPGSAEECPAGGRCWPVEGDGWPVCWPECDAGCAGACDVDGSCVPGPGGACDPACGGYCSQDQGRGLTRAVPGASCACDSDCGPPWSALDPVCVSGVCMLRAPAACASPGSAEGCPAGTRCWPLLPEAEPLCFPDCDAGPCAGVCDEAGSCVPAAVSACEPRCGSFCQGGAR